jgi:hypothetical protein
VRTMIEREAVVEAGRVNKSWSAILGEQLSAA